MGHARRVLRGRLGGEVVRPRCCYFTRSLGIHGLIPCLLGQHYHVQNQLSFGGMLLEQTFLQASSYSPSAQPMAVSTA